MTMTRERKVTAFYNFNRVCSYNAMVNMIIGARGKGKTHGAKKRAIKDALSRGRQFIYVRRHKPEMPSVKATFFADVEHYFPNHEFRVFDSKAQAAEHLVPEENESEASFRRRLKQRVWLTIGFFISLSSAQQVKSSSFAHVYTIIFDEFIIEEGSLTQYLPNEGRVFFNFMNTVDRYEDRITVFMLANAADSINPHFLYWGIEPEPGKEFMTSRNGLVVAHFDDSTEFRKEVMQTRFGQLMAGDPEYSDYAAGNKFADQHGNLIKAKPSTARYWFTLETISGEHSIWFDSEENEYYIQEKQPKDTDTFTMIPNRLSEERPLLHYRDNQISILRTAYRKKRVFFDRPQSRSIYQQIFLRVS